MAIHITTDLGTLMLAFQQQLMAATGFPIERAIIGAPEEFDFHPHGDQYLMLWPDIEGNDRPSTIGSGRINTDMTDRFGVMVRTRLALDDTPSGLIWLTNAQLGHLVLRQLVWNTLIDFQAQDQDENILNFPILPASGARAGRGKRPPLDKTWGESTLWFDVTYQLALDTATFL